MRILIRRKTTSFLLMKRSSWQNAWFSLPSDSRISKDSRSVESCLTSLILDARRCCCCCYEFDASVFFIPSNSLCSHVCPFKIASQGMDNYSILSLSQRRIHVCHILTRARFLKINREIFFLLLFAPSMPPKYSLISINSIFNSFALLARANEYCTVNGHAWLFRVSPTNQVRRTHARREDW